MSPPVPVGVFFALFTASGFAGLIYESIWSHYLRLYLGHAAYAQTLVLAIFMGGMAIGAWLVGRWTRRIPDLLLGYALAELGIGVLALVFHRVFVAVSDWSFDVVIPALGSVAAANAFKLVTAALLILPASILLGATFPLMSGGVLRAFPGARTRTLAWLYFTNGAGAVAGVLASGFVLIRDTGLPGSLLSAGIVNILLALVVWLIARRTGPSTSAPLAVPAADALPRQIAAGLPLLALFTGAASFIYEIAWIRMLTLGLGASTHAFEVMLAAFILGMALGGFALALRPPRAGRDVAWLAVILLAKGACAVVALGAYGQSLEFTRWVMAGLKGSEEGYVLLNLAGLLSSMLVMLPTAFCAGMTLPLATAILMRHGGGEPAIGRVYAANTAGCIAGTVFATHLGMEMLGVRGLTGVGAAIDVALGIGVVLVMLRGRVGAALAALAAAALALTVYAGSSLDQLRMASGVFRTGAFLDPSRATLDFHADGKTATVSVVTIGTSRAIRTNGKSDAAIQMAAGERAGVDEATMTLLGALPIAIRPDARQIANIGFGSGLTTHVLLAHEGPARVDTIEIEAMMVEAARAFQPRNARAYTDPRSHIHIEDARTYFATQQRRYDVIVSEPSNPWVSGVSNLFTDEFYRGLRGYLREGGLLVQWIQAYEIDVDLVSSILQALGRNFSDYVIYSPQSPDLIVVAARDGAVPEPGETVFRPPELRALMARVGYRSAADLRLARIATRRAIEPLVARSRYPMNSDYFPIVDQHAARTRFANASAKAITALPDSFVPVLALLGSDARVDPAQVDLAGATGSPRHAAAREAVALLDLLARGSSAHAGQLDTAQRTRAALVRSGAERCDLDPELWLEALAAVLREIVPFARGEAVDDLLSAARRAACYRALGADARTRVDLYAAVHARDAAAMRAASGRLLAAARALPRDERATVLLADLGARIALGDAAGARRQWAAHREGIAAAAANGLAFRLALAHLGLDPGSDLGGVQ